MSGFDRSEGSRTRTDRVSDSSIVQSYEQALISALEHAEAALMYSEILAHRDAAQGLDVFEKLSAVALRGLTNCQRAQYESESYDIEEIVEPADQDPGYEIVAIEPPEIPGQRLGDRQLTTKRRALTIEDASEFLGCSVEDVRTLLQIGEIVPVFVGRDTRIPLAELERYHHQRQKTCDAPQPTNIPESGENLGEASNSDFDDIVDKLFEGDSFDALGDDASDVMTPAADTTDELRRSNIASLFRRVRGED